jgi:hypothetical protein
MSTAIPAPLMKNKGSDYNENGVPDPARRCRFEFVWAVGSPTKSSSCASSGAQTPAAVIGKSYPRGKQDQPATDTLERHHPQASA